MQKKEFVTTIKEGWDAPYLGVHEGQVSVTDFADLAPDVELISIGRKVKNLHLLPNFKSIRFVDVSIMSAELVEFLAELPKLEVLSVSFDKQEEWPSLKPLSSVKYIILYSLKKIASLDFLQGMTQLESLFLSEILKLNDISALNTTPNIKEFALEGDIHGRGSVLPDIEALFSLKKLEYLKFFSKKTQLNAVDFSNFKNLNYLRISPRRYPFEFYAELEKYLPADVEKEHLLFFPYERDACDKCGGVDYLEAVGARQREFCPTCNRKKLDKLLSTYEVLSDKKAQTALEHIEFLNAAEF